MMNSHLPSHHTHCWTNHINSAFPHAYRVDTTAKCTRTIDILPLHTATFARAPAGDYPTLLVPRILPTLVSLSLTAFYHPACYYRYLPPYYPTCLTTHTLHGDIALRRVWFVRHAAATAL